jgi:hypothetical protein
MVSIRMPDSSKPQGANTLPSSFLFSFTSYGNTCCSTPISQISSPHLPPPLATRVHFPLWRHLPLFLSGFQPSPHFINNRPYFLNTLHVSFKMFPSTLSDPNGPAGCSCCCLTAPSPFKKIALGITLQQVLYSPVPPPQILNSQNVGLFQQPWRLRSEMQKNMAFQTPQGTGFNPKNWKTNSLFSRSCRCDLRDESHSTKMLWDSAVVASDGVPLATLIQNTCMLRGGGEHCVTAPVRSLRHCVFIFLFSVALVRKQLYRPSDRRLSAKLVPTFADSGCCVVSAANSHGR